MIQAHSSADLIVQNHELNRHSWVFNIHSHPPVIPLPEIYHQNGRKAARYGWPATPPWTAGRPARIEPGLAYEVADGIVVRRLANGWSRQAILASISRVVCRHAGARST